MADSETAEYSTANTERFETYLTSMRRLRVTSSESWPTHCAVVFDHEFLCRMTPESEVALIIYWMLDGPICMKWNFKT